MKESKISKHGKSKEKVEEYTIDPDKILKYTRGDRVRVKKTKDRKLKSRLKSREKQYDHAVKQAARSELLLVEPSGYLEAEGLERTHKFKQKEIIENVDIASAAKHFDLQLEQFAPYKINYTKNGKYLLMAGKSGHLAAFDWSRKQLSCEVYARESVRDAKWLHQNNFFAAAQKKYVFIYDNAGTEIHRLKEHTNVNRLEYLPYHFLLASVGNNGYLKYQDTSTGKPIGCLRTKLGRCDCMCQNPYNAVIHLGHYNGCVTMWSPVVNEPLVKMLCHKGPVLSCTVEPHGVYMATSGMDGFMKVWDIRMYKHVYKYKMQGRPANSISISQTGMLALSTGSLVCVFKDALSEKQSMPYMKHRIPGSDIASIQFCPYEDVLGVGHAKGFTSLLVPGSGEANFDAMESNPFESKKQRQEHEVKMLLEKIQPEMIALDPSEVLRMDTDKTKNSDKDSNQEKSDFEPRHKMKGKSSSSKIVQRKKGVNALSKRDQRKATMLEEKRKEHGKAKESTAPDPYASALDRFISNKGK